MQARCCRSIVDLSSWLTIALTPLRAPMLQMGLKREWDRDDAVFYPVAAGIDIAPLAQPPRQRTRNRRYGRDGTLRYDRRVTGGNLFGNKMPASTCLTKRGLGGKARKSHFTLPLPMTEI
jgi:hypothetical protein